MTDTDKPLGGRVALITGAVRRSGRATALALAADGAAIVINARASKDEAEGVAAEVEAAGGRALVHLADVTDEAAVEAMFARIDDEFGRLDILVNNAADRQQVPFVEMTYEQWRHITSIILDGAFLCSRAALQRMTATGWGRLINLGGIGNHMGFTGRQHVNTGKAGLEGTDPRPRHGIRRSGDHRELRLPRQDRRAAPEIRRRNPARPAPERTAGRP